MNAAAILALLQPSEYYEAKPHKATDDIKRVREALEAQPNPPADDVLEAVEHAVRAALSPLGIDYVPWWKVAHAVRDSLLAEPTLEVRPRGTVTEPSDEDVERMRAALNAADIDYSAREQRADAGGGDMEPGDWFTSLARAALRAGAETTPRTVADAEVLRAKAAALTEFADAVRMPFTVFRGDNEEPITPGELMRETAARYLAEAAREARS